MGQNKQFGLWVSYTFLERKHNQLMDSLLAALKCTPKGVEYKNDMLHQEHSATLPSPILDMWIKAAFYH